MIGIRNAWKIFESIICYNIWKSGKVLNWQTEFSDHAIKYQNSWESSTMWDEVESSTYIKLLDISNSGEGKKDLSGIWTAREQA